MPGEQSPCATGHPRTVPSVCTPKHRSRHPLPLPSLGGYREGVGVFALSRVGPASCRAVPGGGSCCLRWVQLEAGPRVLGARGPPARVSFPEGFPVFGCGACCGAARGGVCRAGSGSAEVRAPARGREVPLSVLAIAVGRGLGLPSVGCSDCSSQEASGGSAGVESFTAGLPDGVTCRWAPHQPWLGSRSSRSSPQGQIQTLRGQAQGCGTWAAAGSRCSRAAVEALRVPDGDTPWPQPGQLGRTCLCWRHHQIRGDSP